MTTSNAFPSFTFPDRALGAPKGSEFALHLPSLPGKVRELAILEQATNGNVPDFLRSPEFLSFDTPKGNVCFAVLRDYFCIGTDEDFVRVPMFPVTAQKIANMYSASLPTRFLVNHIWKLSSVQVAPSPMSDKREMTEAFVNHNEVIEKQRRGRAGLMAGHKKDIVLAKCLFSYPDNVVIYGWQGLDGKPIQPLNGVSHNRQYVDYSHGVRLVSRSVLLDGEPMDFVDLLKDPALHVVVSDEGPLSMCAYPLQ